MHDKLDLGLLDVTYVHLLRQKIRHTVMQSNTTAQYCRVVRLDSIKFLFVFVSSSSVSSLKEFFFKRGLVHSG